MATFSYSARPAAGGEMQTGELSLATKDEVFAHLHRQKLIPGEWKKPDKYLRGNPAIIGRRHFRVAQMPHGCLKDCFPLRDAQVRCLLCDGRGELACVEPKPL